MPKTVFFIKAFQVALFYFSFFCKVLQVFTQAELGSVPDALAACFFALYESESTCFGASRILVHERCANPTSRPDGLISKNMLIDQF